jgi:hypothetical protein
LLDVECFNIDLLRRRSSICWVLIVIVVFTVLRLSYCDEWYVRGWGNEMCVFLHCHILESER